MPPEFGWLIAAFFIATLLGWFVAAVMFRSLIRDLAADVKVLFELVADNPDDPFEQAGI